MGGLWIIAEPHLVECKLIKKLTFYLTGILSLRAVFHYTLATAGLYITSARICNEEAHSNLFQEINCLVNFVNDINYNKTGNAHIT
jgi:hypothetical protein